MLTRANILGYRGFPSYSLAGLARVTLLVGKNNSGKTALLECLHFLASGGDLGVLASAAQRRGELVVGTRDDPTFVDVSHMFFGHEIRPGVRLTITGDNGSSAIVIEVSAIDDPGSPEELFEVERSQRPVFAIRVSGGRHRAEPTRPIHVSAEGALLQDRRIGLRRSDDRREGPPTVFVTPDSMDPGSLGGMWNRVLLEKQESHVLDAMKILEPGVEDVVFQAWDPQYRYWSTRSGILVSVEGGERRVPLGSMGDGMRRLLTLAIVLVHARGGYLFIDEIDTGLHYSVMARMWELVVRTAVQNDIQVFATTHSGDCLRGLGELCRLEPTLQGEVAVHKIERGMAKSVAFTGAEAVMAVEQEVELR